MGHVRRGEAQGLQLLGERHRHAQANAACKLDAVLAFRELVAEARIPQQRALGVADQEAGNGDAAGLAVVFSGVREKTHVLEFRATAVERVKADLVDGLRRRRGCCDDDGQQGKQYATKRRRAQHRGLSLKKTGGADRIYQMCAGVAHRPRSRAITASRQRRTCRDRDRCRTDRSCRASA